MDGSCTKSCSNGHNSLSSAMASPWRQRSVSCTATVAALSTGVLVRSFNWWTRTALWQWSNTVTRFDDPFKARDHSSSTLRSLVRYGMSTEQTSSASTRAHHRESNTPRPRWTGQLNAVRTRNLLQKKRESFWKQKIDSISTGCVPEVFKEAYITPRLKKIDWTNPMSDHIDPFRIYQ